MADPISALQLTFTAVRAAVAIGQYLDNKKSREARQPPAATEQTARAYREKPENILYVLAVLGQRLLQLDVINFEALPEARSATRAAFKAGDPRDDDIGEPFDEMDEVLQYAVTCAMVFCAECYPMHIYRGFGCGVLNDNLWADPSKSSLFLQETDASIANLKSQAHEWKLLKKSPTRISRDEPNYERYPEDMRKQALAIVKEQIQQWEKKGMAQPLPPNDYIKINTFSIPFATWAGTAIYTDMGRNWESLYMYQQDPGRYLYAWTVGERLNLRPGEAILLPEEHICALAQWLEGLKGMSIKVLIDTELDWSKIEFSSKTRKFLKSLTGDEMGNTGDPMFIVADPRQQPSVTEQMQNMHISQDSRRRSSEQYPPNPKLPPRRRPVPLPPLPILRVAKALYDFIPEGGEEIGLKVGDVVEIIDDKSEDGWWKARVNGKVGVIPGSFVQ